METGKYILVKNLTSTNSANSLYDLEFKISETVWTARFESDSAYLKTVRTNGQTYELKANHDTITSKYQTYVEYFKKQFKSVYSLEPNDIGCPYGGCLVIFADNSFVWVTYGSGMRFIGVSIGYLDNTNSKLMVSIGW